MISLDEWKTSGKYFDYKGHRIFYKEGGSGQNLLLMHGFPTASYDWAPIWEELTDKFRVIALDMIGYGFSDKPYDYSYSVADHADIYEHLIIFLNIKEIHILTHDYGVSVAQEILARYKDSVTQNNYKILSGCFLNGGIFPEMHKPRLIQKLLLSPIGFILSMLMNEDKFKKSFSEVFGPDTKPTDREISDFWKLISYNKGNLLAHKHIGYMKERKKNRERWVGVILNPPTPIRLINGPADPVSGKHLAEYYKAQVKNPDVVLLAENIGHYPQVEDPKGVLRAFLEFQTRLFG